MKKPQLEDGFTRIANELFEAILSFGLSERQMKVVLSIIRKTYGYGKKEDDMSASQIGALCGMSRNHVTETIGQLAKMGVITKQNGNYGLVIGVNKSHQNWTKNTPPTSPKSGLVPNQDSPKLGLALVVPIRDVTSPDLGQVDSPESGHTKENLPKETQKKARASRRGEETSFEKWIETSKASGIKPIPEDHSVFSYAEKINLPIEYVRLCWLEFKVDHANNAGKKQKNWPQAFSNYVRKNYYRLWFAKDGGWGLTTRGMQLEKEMREMK